MWVGSMLATLSSVVAQLVVSYASINEKVTAAILVLLAIAGYTRLISANLVLISYLMLQQVQSNLLSVGLFGLTLLVALQVITYMNA